MISIEGEKVTFSWRGRRRPVLVGDFNNWDARQAPSFKRVRPGVWEYTTRFPLDAYIEYSYLVDGKRAPDLGNPQRVDSGMASTNHYFYMPEAFSTPLAKSSKGGLRGRLSTHLMQAEVNLENDRDRLKLYRRKVVLYQPPVEQPSPLLVVLDGQDYLRRGRLVQVVENLIRQERIQPIALAFYYHGGRQRFNEYCCSEATVGVIESSLLPLAQAQLDLVDVSAQPGAFGVMGASMGGLMAVYTALRLPQLFGKALSQSGAFFPGLIVHHALGWADPGRFRFWLDVGRYESLLDENRQLASWLQAHGFHHEYREYAGGHNYTAWTNDLWRGLEWLFPKL
jgi:enterochelin esterase family protein